MIDEKKPTVADMVADLEKRGGKADYWFEVTGANFASVLRKAIAEKKVQITEAGGLELLKAPKPKDKELNK